MNITPKPKTVFELFDGHPERWIKGKSALHPIRGRLYQFPSEHYLFDEATCFCLQGAIFYIYGLYNDLSPEIKKIYSKIDEIDTHKWNDAPERTFEEVLAKVKELGI